MGFWKLEEKGRAEGCEGQGAAGAGWRSPEAEGSVGKVAVLFLFLGSCLFLKCCVGIDVAQRRPLLHPVGFAVPGVAGSPRCRYWAMLSEATLLYRPQPYNYHA